MPHLQYTQNQYYHCHKKRKGFEIKIMKICNCFNSIYIKLLALSLVAVALFSYYYFFFLYNRQYNQPAEDNNNWRPHEFFYIVQTWPGSFIPRPRNVRNDFTIHGFWPTYERGESPHDCDPSNPFDISKIQTLVPALSMEWQALNQRRFTTNQDFWKYEWDTHGTCSLDVLNQFQYFQRSLQLKSQTNILQTLRNAGITPNANKKYSLTKIRDSLRTTDGFAPRIVCNTRDSDVQIFEIRYCVNRQGSSFQACTKEDIKCASQVKFPPYTTTNDMNYSLKDESPLQQMVHYYNETLE